MTVAIDRSRLRALLGDMPMRATPPSGTLREVRKRGDASIEDWRLDLNAASDVPATVVTPLQAPRAIVLYCHAHGNNFAIGRSELQCGRPALAQPPYGDCLPQLGLAAVAIDHRGFGDRATPGERVLNKRLLWEGRTLWGMRVADTLSVYDWLRAQDRFAHLPIVTLGLSMGSTMACWTASLEPGIAACVDLCGLAEFDALVASGADDLHGEYWFVPGLRKHFTAAAINALIAPRPHLSCAGRDDPLTPPAGLAAIDAALSRIYAEAGAPAAWRQCVFPCGHEETPAMRAEVLSFLDKVARASGGR
jgi:dienelactone hydrolase